MRPMKFHEVLSSNCVLSNDRAAVGRPFRSRRGICFTGRPLAPQETLILTLSAVGEDEHPAHIVDSDSAESHFFVGLFEADPHTIGNGQNPFDSFMRRAVCCAVKSEREKFRIHLNESLDSIVVMGRGFGPGKALPHALQQSPLYLFFAFSGRVSKLEITSFEFEESLAGNSNLPHELKGLKMLSCSIRNHRFGNFALGPAYLDSSTQREFTFDANVAVNYDPPPSRGNYAFVDAPFTSGSVLFVELTLLKSIKPVLIVLTTQNAREVLEYDSLWELCHRTYSHKMVIEPPGAMDVVGLRISPRGIVYSSVNNQHWIQQTTVDPRFIYHVVVAMEHISVLTVIGIATGTDDIN